MASEVVSTVTDSGSPSRTLPDSTVVNEVTNTVDVPTKSKPPPIDVSEAQQTSQVSHGLKTPTNVSSQMPGISGDRRRTEKERKIGHRRVDEEGQITYKKIQTTQIMGSIQLGISCAVGSLASKPERDLLMQDFAMVETTSFPKDGSNITPAHHYSDFKFKAYAPVAFRYFRDLFGIQPDDFLLSICNEVMRELTNPGASGSIFYLTFDDEFIIKTVQYKEAEFLQKLLPGYYMGLHLTGLVVNEISIGYGNRETIASSNFFLLFSLGKANWWSFKQMRPSLGICGISLPSSVEGQLKRKKMAGVSVQNLNQNPRTLLPKFFGLYCYQCGGKNVRVVVMNNLLPSSIKMHQKYDLKGSTYKRKAGKYERNKESPTFKDLDFMDHHPDGIFLEAETYTALVKTIHRDCRVLESFKIMDYSLLVGIHNLDQASREKMEKKGEIEGMGKACTTFSETDIAGKGTGPEAHRSGAAHSLNLTRSKSINRQRLAAFSTAMESIQADAEPVDQDEDVPPGGIPARNCKGERLLLFLGVIDILQSYRLKKRLEHTWKSMLTDGDTVSVHRPSFYAQRFQDFMGKTVFKKIPSLDLPEIKGPHRKFRTLVSSVIALKHSPSKRKGASVRHRPPSSGECDTIKSESGAVKHVKEILKESPGVTFEESASVIKEVPEEQTEEEDAAVSDVNSRCTVISKVIQERQKSRSNTDSSVNLRTAALRSATGVAKSTSLLEKSDVVSISQATLQTDSVGSVVSETSSSSTSGLGSTIRTVTWTPPHSVEGSTPTHTEGTPSFTESSSSGDIGCPTTPVKCASQETSGSQSVLDFHQYHETNM